MKLHFQKFLVSVFLFSALACPCVFAEEPNDWPEVPESNYTVPEQILTPDMFSDMNSTIMKSIQSVANQGLRVFFIVGGVMLVANVADVLTAHQRNLHKAVERRKFNREAEALDMDRNRTEIIRSRMRHKEIDLVADARFRSENYDKLVENGVHKAELQHSITERIRKLHPDWEFDEAIRKRFMNEFVRRHFSKITTREKDEKEAEFKREYSEAKKRDAYMESNREYYEGRKKK